MKNSVTWLRIYPSMLTFPTFAFGRLGPFLDTVNVEDLVALLTVEHGVLGPDVLEADEALQAPLNQLLDKSLPETDVPVDAVLAFGSLLAFGLRLPHAIAATRGRQLLSGQGQLALAYGGDGSLNVKGERG